MSTPRRMGGGVSGRVIGASALALVGAAISACGGGGSGGGDRTSTDETALTIAVIDDAVEGASVTVQAPDGTTLLDEGLGTDSVVRARQEGPLVLAHDSAGQLGDLGLDERRRSVRTVPSGSRPW